MISYNIYIEWVKLYNPTFLNNPTLLTNEFLTQNSINFHEL